MTEPFLKINNRIISPSHPMYVIAELSANHNQNFRQAVKLIETAKEIGADAVKLQTYTPDTITLDSKKKHFIVSDGLLWKGKSLYDLYKEAYTPWSWQPKLKKVADSLKLPLFSSPFDPSAVDFLEKMNVPAYKIASFELVDIPLITKVAQTQKPIILSTGMATFNEVRNAVRAVRSTGNHQIALLKCTSAYPASHKEANLKSIPHLAKSFSLPVGVSDHTMGNVVPLMALAFGACIVEKHLTLSRSCVGPDSSFSLEPNEFKQLIDTIRVAQASIGEIHYGPTKSEKKAIRYRRSLFVVRDIKKGETFKEQNIRSIRPSNGLPPSCLFKILGTHARKNIASGTPLRRDHLC